MVKWPDSMCACVWKLERKTNNEKFWEELVAYFPLIRHGPHRKRKSEDTPTHRQQGDLIRLLLFFQNNESRLKRSRNKDTEVQAIGPIERYIGKKRNERKF
jgi:hypothetical protein